MTKTGFIPDDSRRYIDILSLRADTVRRRVDLTGLDKCGFAILVRILLLLSRGFFRGLLSMVHGDKKVASAKSDLGRKVSF